MREVAMACKLVIDDVKALHHWSVVFLLKL